MSRTNLKPAVLALALITAVAGARAQGFLDNFDSPFTLANYNAYLNTATPTWGPAFLVTNSPYSWVSSGGVGNSGAVSLAAGSSTITADASLIYHNSSFNLAAPNTALTISAELNVSAINGGGNRLLQLGFVNGSTNGMNGNAGVAFTSLRLSTVGTTGDTYTPQYQTKLASGSTVSTAFTPNVTLTPGEWYELSGTFVNIGGGNLQASGFLQDEGKDGLTPGAVVFTFPTMTLNSGTADIASDTAVWGALRGFKSDGLSLVDNFGANGTVVVPEPGTAALVGLAAAVLLAARRRKA